MMGRMRAWFSAFAWCVLMASASAQSTWFVHGSDASVRVVGETRALLRGPCPAPTMLPAGDYDVHFGTDALGKPISLSLPVSDHAVVTIAVAPAGAVLTHDISPVDEAWTDTAGGSSLKASWVARCAGSAEAASYRVVAMCSGGGPVSACGVVARWRDGSQHYRFVWDRGTTELRLERMLGPDLMVLARAAAPAHDQDQHALALQVDGFRLQAFFDDAPVLQAFDGAFTAGAFGTWVAGDAVTWQRVIIEPPAPPRGSSAIVRDHIAASFHAGTTVTSGHYHVLEFLLDRPHPIVPLTGNGMEIWLMQRPAAPQVLLADWRESLGVGALGEVPRDGLFASEVRWPILVGLQRQAVLVRALLVSPDGEAVVGATPAVPLWF